MILRTIRPRGDEAESEIPATEKRAVSGSPKKRILLVSTICLLAVIGLSYLGYRLISEMMVKPMARTEAERVASHIRRVFRNIDSEIIWKDPHSPEAAEIFKQIRRNPMLIYRERLWAFKVWDNTGKLIWPKKKTDDESSQLFSDKRIVPKNYTVYKLKPPGHDKIEKDKYQSNIVMETYVPIWRDGGENSGIPDLIAEAYTDPLFIGGYLMGGWNLILVYTSIIGFIVYVILLGVLI